MTALTMTISLCLKWSLMVLHMEAQNDASSEAVTVQLVFTALSEMVGPSLSQLQFALAFSFSPFPSRPLPFALTFFLALATPSHQG
jgi:hypothetical protein